jgi:uncharacterized protein
MNMAFTCCFQWAAMVAELIHLGNVRYNTILKTHRQDLFMHIMVDIGHPGDVHVFYHPIQNWLSHGHTVTITAMDKDVARQLLDSYGLPYHTVGVRKGGVLNLAYLLLMRPLKIASIALKDRPDIFVSICSATMAIASKLVGRPHVVFDDSEFGNEQIAIYKPFTDAMCTPRQFERDFGKRQVRYDGFKELAYLHPDIFTPNPQVLRDLGIDPDEKYFVLRLVSWDAAHDRGEHGLSKAGHDQLLARLQQEGRVIVSYEGKVPKDLSTGKDLPVPAMLHLLAFANLFVSEGLTMVTEAALLGTPAILVNTLQAGNMKILRDRYKLIETHENDTGALDCVERWLANPNLKAEAAAKRQILLGEVVNVSDWITNFVEDFVRNKGLKPTV